MNGWRFRVDWLLFWKIEYCVDIHKHLDGGKLFNFLQGLYNRSRIFDRIALSMAGMATID